MVRTARAVQYAKGAVNRSVRTHHLELRRPAPHRLSRAPTLLSAKANLQLIMKLYLAVSAVLAVFSTRVECFVSNGGHALAHGVRPTGIATNTAFVQPISR